MAGARVSGFILVLCLILTATVAAEAPRILIVGDSLSAGFGIPVDSSWPVLLQQRLREEGYPHRVENASISGDTTRGAARRLPRLLERHSPELVIIELGANDGLRGLPVAEAEANLRRMLDDARGHGARILLFEMRIPPNYGPAYSDQFTALYENLGALDDVRLVPFFLAGVVLDPALMQNDGLHPNAAAQPLMLDNVWAYVEDEISY